MTAQPLAAGNRPALPNLPEIAAEMTILLGLLEAADLMLAGIGGSQAQEGAGLYAVLTCALPKARQIAADLERAH